MRVGEKHSQHEILLPAWLTASHSDGRALNILHLQGHVCVKFLCRKSGVQISLVMFLFIPNSVILFFLFLNNKKQCRKVVDTRGTQLTLWSIKLGFLHCKHVEKMNKG